MANPVSLYDMSAAGDVQSFMHPNFTVSSLSILPIVDKQIHHHADASLRRLLHLDQGMVHWNWASICTTVICKSLTGWASSSINAEKQSFMVCAKSESGLASNSYGEYTIRNRSVLFWKSIFAQQQSLWINLQSQLILQLFFSASTTSKSGRPVTCILYFAQIPYTLQCVSTGQCCDGSMDMSGQSPQILQQFAALIYRTTLQGRGRLTSLLPSQ